MSSKAATLRRSICWSPEDGKIVQGLAQKVGCGCGFSGRHHQVRTGSDTFVRKIRKANCSFGRDRTSTDAGGLFWLGFFFRRFAELCLVRTIATVFVGTISEGAL